MFKVRDLFKSISYSVFANGVSLVISVLITLFVPKIIGVTEYGYLQLFIFYTSYIGFFHLGICDGIYLKYGGKDFSKVDKLEFTSQFYFLTFLEIFISILIIIFALNSNGSFERNFVIICTAVSIVIVIPKLLCIYILQTCNEIKKYSFLLLIERIIYGFLTIFIILFIKEYTFCWIIIADLLGKLIALLFAVFYCRNLFTKTKIPVSYMKNKSLENLRIGSKLLLANLATLLIIGLVRMNIENFWGIDVFAKVSLSLSISSFILTFISAIGIAIFPIIKRCSDNQYKHIYMHLDFILSIVLFFVLIFYFPVSKILVIWLPKYSDSVMFLAILFPIFIYDSKNSLLINTFYKSLRFEKELLIINLITVCLSFFGSYICIYYLNNLIITLFFIVVLFAFKNLISEIYICKYFEIGYKKNKFMETIMVFLFIVLNYYYSSILSFGIYISIFFVYLLLYISVNKTSFVFFKNTILKRKIK